MKHGWQLLIPTLSLWVGASLAGCASRQGLPGTNVQQDRSTAIAQIVATDFDAVEQLPIVVPASSPARATLIPNQVSQLPEKFWDVTLDELRNLAFHNGTIIRDLGGQVLSSPAQVSSALDREIVRNDPQFGPQAALSAFDHSFANQLFFDRNDRAFNNQTVGGGAFELQQDLVTAQSRVSKRSMSGAEWALQGTTIYDDNNRSGNLFPNSWESYVEGSVRQPLLRGAGWAFNSIAGPNASPGFNFSNGIVLAKLNVAISEVDFEIAVRNHLRQVEETYWQLYAAYRELEARQSARDAAEKTWQSVRARADQRLAGGEADKEAQAKFQWIQYQELFFEALNGSSKTAGVYETERKLRKLVGLTATDGYLIRPREPLPVAPLTYDWPCLLQTGLQQRPEIRRQALRVRQTELRFMASRNFLLPRLDAFGAYRVRGLGDDLAGDGPRLASAWQDMESLEHQEWRLGVEMEMPAGMRQGRAALNHAQLQLAREREILQNQELFVSHELSDAVARVSHLQIAVDLAQQKQQAAEQRFQSTSAQYDTGHATVDLLLEAQEQWFESNRQYYATHVSQVLAITQVHVVAGTYLAEMNVVVSQ